MFTRLYLLALAFTSAACQPSPAMTSDTGDDSVCEAGLEGCPCAGGMACAPGLLCASQICVDDQGGSTGPTEESSSEAGNESSETGTSSSTTGSTSGSTSSSSSTTDAVTGDTGDSSTTGIDPFCGDGEVDAGEECDDGNPVAGDGCDACAFEPWSHEGVAVDVPEAELHGWEPCWSDTYEAGSLLSQLLESCHGDHVLLACRPLNSSTLSIAAHAPRGDVFFEPEVNYPEGERHHANGVAWYWAPYHGTVGFAPGGNAQACGVDGEDEQMCWRVSGNLPLQFSSGRRCGAMLNPDAAESKQWERVAFQRTE